jgi:hypothetical protein
MKKPIPMGPALFIFGSGGRICPRGFAAQLLLPLIATHASLRLRVNLRLCRFKTCSTQNKIAGPDKTGPGIFIW